MGSWLLQERIDAEQSLATIEYGLRSLDLCGIYGCTGLHAGQLVNARYEAGRVLGRDGAIGEDNGTKRLLRLARDQAREWLKTVKAEIREQGGIRQLRLAIAAEGAHDSALAA
jgi:hypothetical protein